MAKLNHEDINAIVDAILAELDRRKQIEQLADAVVRKQAELNRKLMAAPQQYPQRDEVHAISGARTETNDSNNSD